MVEQIEYPISSGPSENINNWVEIKKTFRNAAATLRAHKMGKLSGQTYKSIEMEVNSFLFSSGSNKRRVTDEPKALCAFRLVGREDEKKSEERITLKVWNYDP